MHKNMKVILGSGSKWRRKVAEKLLGHVETFPPNIDEKSIRSDDPRELATKIARAKMEAVRSSFSDEKEEVIIITGDQVIEWNGQIREKPLSQKEAQEYIRSYMKISPKTVSALCVWNSASGMISDGVDECLVHFESDIPEEVISKATEEGSEVYYCCGALQVDNPHISKYVKSMDGPLDSVWGFPEKLLRRLLSEVHADTSLA